LKRLDDRLIPTTSTHRHSKSEAIGDAVSASNAGSFDPPGAGLLASLAAAVIGIITSRRRKN
jgi:hypothetical protein